MLSSATPPSAGPTVDTPVLELRALTRTHGSGIAEVHALRGIPFSPWPEASTRRPAARS